MESDNDSKVDKYEDHKWCLDNLDIAQEEDRRQRENAREAHAFIDEEDGQWDQAVIDNMPEGKPRFTFDLVDPVIDQIAGELERQDYDIKISPAGGASTKDIAKTYDGIIRNIENISNADVTYNAASRNVCTAGLDGWRVVQDYADGDTFDQDLLIEGIPNYLERVWHGPHSKPDASDASYAWIITWMSEDEFESKYPGRDKSSIARNYTVSAYWTDTPERVGVGEFLYLKEEPRTIVKMSNGDVYEKNAEFETVKDDLAIAGITVVDERERPRMVVYTREFDDKGWIDDKPQETVFQNWVPVVPMYGNFKVTDSTRKYRGAVRKLMDPQRVFNYGKSREIEEGALAPREKILATEAMAEGHAESWSTLNTNTDPVMFWTPDEDVPGMPPSKILGPQVNQGLSVMTESMRGLITQQAGKFAASMGDNPGLQSGVAIEALQDKAGVADNKYILCREIAQEQTARILVNAIPRIYTPGRQVRLLKEDNSYDMAIIGQPVPDAQSGQLVVLNDLSQGTYDVNCTSGPSFKNRQNETVRAMTEIGQVDPTVMEIGSDILLANIAAPGMDQVAKRKRKQAFDAGLIAPEDMTDEERQQLAQAENQPPAEDPNMVLAKAEEASARADLANAETKMAEAQAKIHLSQKEIQLKKGELSVRAFEADTKRIQTQIDAHTAKADIQQKGASAAKSLAEAEAVDFKTDFAKSGMERVMEGLQGE